MSALGHYLEAEGLPTVQISLVREHTEALGAPRALWVPFVLGRPLGVPGDRAFQSRVLRAALELLTRTEGPVLEDYPEDAPDSDRAEDLAGLVCPVSFPGPVATGTPQERVIEEVTQLAAWHDVACRHRGRTMLGVTGLAPHELAGYIGAWAEAGRQASFRPDLRVSDALRLACDELRTFYSEAKSVQPGGRTPAEIQRWYWQETAAGRIVRSIRNRLEESDDPGLQALASSGLVPRVFARDDAPGG